MENLRIIRTEVYAERSTRTVFELDGEEYLATLAADGKCVAMSWLSREKMLWQILSPKGPRFAELAERLAKGPVAPPTEGVSPPEGGPEKQADSLQTRAAAFVANWDKRARNQLAHPLKIQLQETAKLLWRMEGLANKEAAYFAMTKWRRIGQVLTQYVRAIERRQPGDARLANATLRKLCGEVSHYWSKVTPKKQPKPQR